VITIKWESEKHTRKRERERDCSSVSIVKSVSLVENTLKMSSDNFNFESLESVLNKNLLGNELSEVKRVLYGRTDE
jgi:hypothetical protein